MRKTIAVFVTLLLFVSGIAYAKDYEVKKKVGEYEFDVTIDKNPPVVGINNITILIRDASGKYVKDARVKVEYSMPAMPGMPAMNYKTDTELKGTEYRAKMNFSMSGSWNIAIRMDRAGKTTTMKFNMDVR